jgi:hypothetical protein
VWLTALLALAYLPDLAAQVLRFTVLGDPRQATHSLCFAVLASVPVTWALTRSTGGHPARIFAVVLGSVLLHDVLDILQWPGRQPLWPFSAWTPGLEPLLPRGAMREVMVFGGATVAAQAILAWRLRRAPRAGARWLGIAGMTRGGRLAIVLLLGGAVETHYWRAVREDQALLGTRLLHGGDPVGALAALDRAARWPSVARPARLDHLRAEALSSLGRSEEAEPLFLRARQGDPSSFWTLADLADFYAASSRPLVERRRLVSPLLAEIEARFPTHPRRREVVRRVEGRLVPAGPESIDVEPREPTSRPVRQP